VVSAESLTGNASLYISLYLFSCSLLILAASYVTFAILIIFIHRNKDLNVFVGCFMTLSVSRLYSGKGWEGSVPELIQALSQICLKGLRHTTTNLSQDSWCPARDSNQAPQNKRLERYRYVSLLDETVKTMYHTIRRHIPEESNIHDSLPMYTLSYIEKV
jgi:hypothetical protein